MVPPSPLSNSRALIFIILKRNSVPISSHSPFLPPLSCWKPLAYFLPLEIDRSETFYVNKIIQYVVFCSWLFFLSMFSSFIHVIVAINILFIFYGWIIFHCIENYILLIFYQVMKIRIIPIWGLLCVMLLCIKLLWPLVHKVLCGHMLQSFLAFTKEWNR